MDDLYIHTKCDYGQIMIHPLKCVIYNQFKQTQKNEVSITCVVSSFKQAKHRT